MGAPRLALTRKDVLIGARIALSSECELAQTQSNSRNDSETCLHWVGSLEGTGVCRFAAVSFKLCANGVDGREVDEGLNSGSAGTTARNPDVYGPLSAFLRRARRCPLPLRLHRRTNHVTAYI